MVGEGGERTWKWWTRRKTTSSRSSSSSSSSYTKEKCSLTNKEKKKLSPPMYACISRSFFKCSTKNVSFVYDVKEVRGATSRHSAKRRSCAGGDGGGVAFHTKIRLCDGGGEHGGGDDFFFGEGIC